MRCNEYQFTTAFNEDVLVPSRLNRLVIAVMKRLLFRISNGESLC